MMIYWTLYTLQTFTQLVWSVDQDTGQDTAWWCVGTTALSSTGLLLYKCVTEHWWWMNFRRLHLHWGQTLPGLNGPFSLYRVSVHTYLITTSPWLLYTPTLWRVNTAQSRQNQPTEVTQSVLRACRVWQSVALMPRFVWISAAKKIIFHHNTWAWVSFPLRAMLTSRYM